MRAAVPHPTLQAVITPMAEPLWWNITPGNVPVPAAAAPPRPAAAAAALAPAAAAPCAQPRMKPAPTRPRVASAELAALAARPATAEEAARWEQAQQAERRAREDAEAARDAECALPPACTSLHTTSRLLNHALHVPLHVHGGAGVSAASNQQAGMQQGHLQCFANSPVLCLARGTVFLSHAGVSKLCAGDGTADTGGAWRRAPSRTLRLLQRLRAHLQILQMAPSQLQRRGNRPRGRQGARRGARRQGQAAQSHRPGVARGSGRSRGHSRAGAGGTARAE